MPRESPWLAGRGAIEDNPVLARLLLWLDVHAQQHPGTYADVTLFVEELLEDEDPTTLAVQLEQRGLVDVARSFAGSTDVYLTDKGRVAVYQLKNLQKDHAARLRYTMDAFLRWMFDTAGNQTPVRPDLFLETSVSTFAGAAISGPDLHRTLDYLAEHSLIERVDTDPATVAISPEGVRCILSGRSVQDTSSSPTETIAQDLLIGEQQNATQTSRDQFAASDETHEWGVRHSAAVHGGDEAVRSQTPGDPKAYRREKFPLPGSTQADVFRATHKASGNTVAVKQLRVKSSVGMRAARMRREIEAGKVLDGHPHAMPILDHAADHTWFVMPWADSTAEDHWAELRDPQRLRPLVDALTSVLAEAHRYGWIHRDIKPPNILLLEGRWVLADWGTVRRPAGQTTKVDRTRAGIGTEGFSAPELFTHPSQRPQPSSDVYSIGRVIAWALTGSLPLSNKQLLPDPGPWRNIVRAATREEPSHRPQSMSNLVALIERELAVIPADPLEEAAVLLEQANNGDSGAADAFLALVTDHTEDFELYAGQLPLLPAHLAAPALAHDLPQAQTVLQSLTEHVGGTGTRRVEYAEASRVVVWLQGIAAHAAAERQWDLLEEAMQALCTWDGFWDRWDARSTISPWLRSLKNEAAAVAAAALRDHPDSAEHFSHFADDRTVDPQIRRAVRQV